MSEALTLQGKDVQPSRRLARVRVRFAAQDPIGRAAPPLSPGPVVRVGVVVALAITAGINLARDGAPALTQTGQRVFVAHVDSQTRALMRRTGLADRLPSILDAEAAQAGTSSRTFALVWKPNDSPYQFRPRRSGGARESEDATIVTASLRPYDQAVTARSGTGARGNLSIAPPTGVVEQVLSAAYVVDGRTLAQGSITIQLVGVDLPAPTQFCLLLNGMTEPCAKRMATQLELMTRWRQVVCRYDSIQSERSIGEPLVGQCRIGNTDLGQRLAQVVRKAPATESFQQPTRAASL